ncbi:MAG: hypothetical protein OXU50_04000 [Gammaproteobacteria bacterium]|nr:hypothetical protein [Gammaproteobacteria bacterium]
MSKNTTPRRTFRIHVGKYGGVRVDPDEFFADPVVREQIELMKKTKLVGKKLDFRKRSPEKPD